MTATTAVNRLSYPLTRKGKEVDDYHGTKVADPYRWLENSASRETTRWIDAQHALTTEYLSALPGREALRSRLAEVVNYPRYTAPFRKGPYLFWRRNEGLQDQAILWVQRGLDGAPEVLVDPNLLASDGTVRLTCTVPSSDGRYLGYGLSRGGSDWEDYFVKDVATRRDLPDHVRMVKYSTIAWRGDGFYYCRYPVPGGMAAALAERNLNHQVWYHRLGTPQSADTCIYADPSHPLHAYCLITTDDERFAVLYVSGRGAGHDGNALYTFDAEREASTPTPVVTDFDHRFLVIDSEGDRLLVLTNRAAPNRRVVAIDPTDPSESAWDEIIAEREEPIEHATTAGGKLFVTYRRDATHRVLVFTRHGALEGDIALPAPGLTAGFTGQRGDADVFWAFTSFTYPTAIYRYDILRRVSSVYRRSDGEFDGNDYDTKQVFFPSKDGTSIPMFIVHRKGLVLDGTHAALVSGYGGFGLAVGPSFDPLLIPLLERGVVYALMNVRGGGEYGEQWHHAGWRHHKQNVFDDCIAGLEWLQRSGYTSRDRCALYGASNGGLLVATVMTQRPDLCAVALPSFGVMDMLRFHRFTVAGHWTAEYGSSEDPELFPVLRGYSPLHNVRPGVSYPATLVLTADHDDRVVPAHSFKFVATLQECGSGPNPYLLRIDTASGHGAVSVTKELNERADLYAFVLAHVGVATAAPEGPASGVGSRAIRAAAVAPTNRSSEGDGGVARSR